MSEVRQVDPTAEELEAIICMQAFFRGCICRQKVSEWIAVLIEELRVAQDSDEADEFEEDDGMSLDNDSRHTDASLEEIDSRSEDGDADQPKPVPAVSASPALPNADESTAQEDQDEGEEDPSSLRSSNHDEGTASDSATNKAGVGPDAVVVTPVEHKIDEKSKGKSKGDASVSKSKKTSKKSKQSKKSKSSKKKGSLLDTNDANKPSFSEASKTTARRSLERQDSWVAKQFSKGQDRKGGTSSRKSSSLISPMEDLQESNDELNEETPQLKTKSGTSSSKGSSKSKSASRSSKRSPISKKKKKAGADVASDDEIVTLKLDGGADKQSLSGSTSDDEFEVIDGLRFPKSLPQSFLSDSDVSVSSDDDSSDLDSWNGTLDTQQLSDSGNVDSNASVASSIMSSTPSVSDARAAFESRQSKDTSSGSRKGTRRKSEAPGKSRKDPDVLDFAARQYVLHSSATRIQATVRGYLYRKKDFEAMMDVIEWVQHYQEKEVETVSQAAAQQEQMKDADKPIPVEAVKRRNAFSERQNKLHKAAVKIQAAARGFLARKVDYGAMMDALMWIEEFRVVEQANENLEKLKEEKTVPQSQSTDAQSKGGPKPLSAFAQRQLKLFKAAVAIQSLARGYLCRRVDVKAAVKAVMWVKAFQKVHPEVKQEDSSAGEASSMDGSEPSADEERPEVNDVVKVVSFFENAGPENGPATLPFSQKDITGVLNTHQWLQQRDAPSKDSNAATRTAGVRASAPDQPTLPAVQRVKPKMKDLVKFYEWMSTNGLTFPEPTNTFGDDDNDDDDDAANAHAPIQALESFDLEKPMTGSQKAQLKELKTLWNWLESKDMDMGQFTGLQTLVVDESGSADRARTAPDQPVSKDGSVEATDGQDQPPSLGSMVKYWNFSKALMSGTSNDDDSSGSEPLEWVIDNDDDDDVAGAAAGGSAGSADKRGNSSQSRGRSRGGTPTRAPSELQKYSAKASDDDNGMPINWVVDDETDEDDGNNDNGAAGSSSKRLSSMQHHKQQQAPGRQQRHVEMPSALQNHGKATGDDGGPIEWVVDDESDEDEDKEGVGPMQGGQQRQRQRPQSNKAQRARVPSALQKYSANADGDDGGPIEWVVDDHDDDDDSGADQGNVEAGPAREGEQRQRPQSSEVQKASAPSVLQKYSANANDDDDDGGPIEWVVDDDADDDNGDEDKVSDELGPAQGGEQRQRQRQRSQSNNAQRARVPSALHKYKAKNEDDEEGPIAWVVDSDDDDNGVDANSGGTETAGGHVDDAGASRSQRPGHTSRQKVKMPSFLQKYSNRQGGDEDAPIDWVVDDVEEDGGDATASGQVSSSSQEPSQARQRQRPSAGARAGQQRSRVPSALQKYSAADKDNDDGLPIAWVIDEDEDEAPDSTDDPKDQPGDMATPTLSRQRPAKNAVRPSRVPSELQKFATRTGEGAADNEGPIEWVVDDDDDGGDGDADDNQQKQSHKRAGAAQNRQGKLSERSAGTAYGAQGMERPGKASPQRPASSDAGRASQGTTMPSVLKRFSVAARDDGADNGAPIEWAVDDDDESDGEGEVMGDDTTPKQKTHDQSDWKQRYEVAKKRPTTRTGGPPKLPSVLQKYATSNDEEEEDQGPIQWVVDDEDAEAEAEAEDGSKKTVVKGDSRPTSSGKGLGSQQLANNKPGVDAQRRRPSSRTGARAKIPSILQKYSARTDDDGDEQGPIRWVIDEDEDDDGGVGDDNRNEIPGKNVASNSQGATSQQTLQTQGRGGKARPGLGEKEPSFVKRYSVRAESAEGLPIAWDVYDSSDDDALGENEKTDAKRPRNTPAAPNPTRSTRHDKMMNALSWLSTAGLNVDKMERKGGKKEGAKLSSSHQENETKKTEPAISSTPSSSSGATKGPAETLRVNAPKRPSKSSHNDMKTSLAWLEKKGISTGKLKKPTSRKQRQSSAPSVSDMESAMKWIEQQGTKAKTPNAKTSTKSSANNIDMKAPSKEEMAKAMEWMNTRKSTDAKETETKPRSRPRTRPTPSSNNVQKPRQKSAKPPSASDMENALSWLAKQESKSSVGSAGRKKGKRTSVSSTSTAGRTAAAAASNRDSKPSSAAAAANKRRSTLAAAPSTNQMEKAMLWLQKSEKRSNPATSSSKTPKSKNRVSSDQVKETMMRIGGPKATPQQSKVKKPQVTKPKKWSPEEAKAKARAANAQTAFDKANGAEIKKALLWLETGAAEDAETSAHYKKLDSILPKKFGETKETRARELIKAMKWVKKKGLAMSDDRQPSAPSTGAGKITSPRARRRSSQSIKPLADLRGGNESMGGKTTNKSGGPVGEQSTPKQQRKIRGQGELKKTKSSGDDSASTASGAKQSGKSKKGKRSQMSETELMDMQHAMLWLQSKDDDTLPDANYFTKLDSMLPKRQGQTLQQRAREMVKALCWVRKTSTPKNETTTATAKGKTTKRGNAKGQLPGIREASTGGGGAEKKVPAKKRWDTVTANLSKIMADSDSEKALRYLKSGREVDKSDGEYFKKLDAMLPKRRGQSDQDRAVEMAKAMKFLRKKGIDSKKDEASGDAASSAEAESNPENDLDNAIKWLQFTEDQKPTGGLPDAEYFKKLDKMLPKKNNQKIEKRAEEMVKMLAWMRKKGLNKKGRK